MAALSGSRFLKVRIGLPVKFFYLLAGIFLLVLVLMIRLQWTEVLPAQLPELIIGFSGALAAVLLLGTFETHLLKILFFSGFILFGYEIQNYLFDEKPFDLWKMIAILTGIILGMIIHFLVLKKASTKQSSGKAAKDA